MPTDFINNVSDKRIDSIPFSTSICCWICRSPVHRSASAVKCSKCQFRNTTLPLSDSLIFEMFNSLPENNGESQKYNIAYIPSYRT